MIGRVTTVAFHGINVVDVDVQVTVSGGVNAFAIVGLADKAAAESKERVRAALAAIGLGKEGSHYDLPIALGLLAAMKVIPADLLVGYTALGELGLDGSLAPVAGVLPAALATLAAGRGLICPAADGAEAAWAGKLDIVAVPHLLSLINHLKGTQLLAAPAPAPLGAAPPVADLRDIKGQETAKRALEIAAAGGHNLLMIGPPGAGKSMLAARLPGLLPPLSAAEILDVSMIASVAGLLRNGRLSRRRPFRAPHHNASPAARSFSTNCPSFPARCWKRCASRSKRAR